jgi:ribonuclease BN (tRNA processing enzyme)
VEEAVHGADLLLVEAALRSDRHDDPERGHLTAPEAIALARSARAGSALLVHFGPERLAELENICAAAGPWVRPAIDGLTITVKPSVARTATDTSLPASDSVADPAAEPSRA